MGRREEVLEQIAGAGVVGIIRMQAGGPLLEMARAIASGGIACLEITLNTPGALDAIRSLHERSRGTVLGAGTVLDARSVQEAVDAGARFVVTPSVRDAVVRAARRLGIAAIVGAMTPTEALLAWEIGADLVKVFPASIVGPAFLREMRGPLPQIPLVPTGGITADNAGEFIRAGAVAVCAGSWLVDKQAVAEGRFDLITEKARHLVEAVRKAREEVA